MREPVVWARAERTAAVSELFMAHHRRLVGLASLFVDDRESAEEVVQDAFLALYRRWRLLCGPSATVSYLNACVVNGGRARLRRRARQGTPVQLAAEHVGSLPSAEQTAVAHDEYDRIWAEIADTLGVSRGSVKTHATRGLATLARRLDIQP